MIVFKMYPPIEDTMIMEQEFDEETRMSLEEKKDLLKQAIVCGIYFNYQLIGEWYGFKLECLPEKDPEDQYCPGDDFPKFGTKSYSRMWTFYCYSNGLKKEFQRQGYGSILKAHMLGYLRALGFGTVIGHSHENGSIQLNERFGAKRIHCFNNWYETGHRYWLYEINL